MGSRLRRRYAEGKSEMRQSADSYLETTCLVGCHEDIVGPTPLSEIKISEAVLLNRDSSMG
jgi:hypothetical protein